MQEPETAEAHLARISVFPVKSLDGADLESCDLLPTGALSEDRRWAIFDQAGHYVNGKKNARVHLLRSSYDPRGPHLELSAGGGGSKASFDLHSQREDLERWLGDFFGFPVFFRENREAGFPDDTESPGPTVISTATLRAVADWFDLSLEQTRARFRSNLELDGVPAFWEDRLYAQAGTTVRFSVGAVELEGVNPCQRCVVPPRDPVSGEPIPDFSKRFMELRRKHLPSWAEASRFNHFYRLAVNTRLSASGPGRVAVADKVKIGGAAQAA